MALHFHAKTFLTYDGSALVSARVFVSRTETIAQIAHELEHVVEQLDRIRLQGRASSAAAWKATDGSYETRRAIEVGRQVAHEVRAGGNDAMGRAPRDPRRGMMTLLQRNRHSWVASRPSARVSGSGRFVVFASVAQLVEADRNQHSDIYVFDRVTGQLTLESDSAAIVAGIGWSEKPDISTDGRYVVFESTPEHSLPGSNTQVLLRDRSCGVTRLLSDMLGHGFAGGTQNAAISADGTTPRVRVTYAR